MIIERRFILFGYRVLFRTNVLRAAELLSALYVGRDDPSFADPAGVYELWHSERTPKWTIDVPGPGLHEKPSFGEAISAVEAAITADLTRYPHRLHVVHGGVVYGPAGDLLLSGDSGAGKTTLSLGLATRGFRVGGDDMSVYDPAGDTYVPHPRCFHIDARSAELLAGIGLALPAEGMRDQFVTPGDLGLASPPAARVRYVFLLEPERLAAPRIEPETQAQAAARLLMQTGRGQFTGMDGVRAIARLTGGARCFRLWSGELGATVEAVAQLSGV